MPHKNKKKIIYNLLMESTLLGIGGARINIDRCSPLDFLALPALKSVGENYNELVIVKRCDKCRATAQEL